MRVSLPYNALNGGLMMANSPKSALIPHHHVSFNRSYDINSHHESLDYSKNVAMRKSPMKMDARGTY